ncbi:hypothetical protein E2C01_078275 [Portunus trituberculatus]|uniref:Uncharacterized protein n=1 Tax=Portunus trituberculatus TaxID=210409 RepID=A0A5B7IM75_PORTR|nr:hypothetical protein [Portunus trituberculatus]
MVRDSTLIPPQALVKQNVTLAAHHSLKVKGLNRDVKEGLTITRRERCMGSSLINSNHNNSGENYRDFEDYDASNDS